MARRTFANRASSVWNGLVVAWALLRAAIVLLIVGGLLYAIFSGGSRPSSSAAPNATAIAIGQIEDGVRCSSEGSGQLVTLKVGSMTFALNGTARGLASQKKWVDGKQFFEPARLGQLLEQGLALCGTNRVEAPVLASALKKPEPEREELVATAETPLTQSGLIKAANDGDMAFVQRWVATKKSVNFHNGYDSTPVGVAAASGHCDVLDLLLKHGGIADPKNVRVGSTPLYHAAMGGYPQCVALLLKRHVRLDVRIARGDSTALIAASYQGNAEVVKLLVDAGASLTITNNDGDTAYSAANAFSNYAAAAYIHSKGGR